MDMQDLRNRQGIAKRDADKDGKARLDHLMSQVEEREKIRIKAVGAIEKAEADLHSARGELTAAESNLKKFIEALEAEMGKVTV